MGVVGGQHVFQLLLFLGQLVEIGAFLGVGGVDLFQPLLRVEDLGDAFLDHFAHGLFRVQVRLLRQVADLGARLGAGFALEVLVHAGHDPQHGGLAGAVDAEQADLGAGEEAERDVLDDLALRGNDLADPVHGVDVLRAWSLRRRCAALLARAGAVKGIRQTGHYTGVRGVQTRCRSPALAREACSTAGIGGRKRLSGLHFPACLPILPEPLPNEVRMFPKDCTHCRLRRRTGQGHRR